MAVNSCIAESPAQASGRHVDGRDEGNINFSCNCIAEPYAASACLRRQVDGMWRAMMKATHDAPAVIPIAREKERVDKLVECNSLLDAIQKGLAAYLEKKRLFFPR